MLPTIFPILSMAIATMQNDNFGMTGSDLRKTVRQSGVGIATFRAAAERLAIEMEQDGEVARQFSNNRVRFEHVLEIARNDTQETPIRPARFFTPKERH